MIKRPKFIKSTIAPNPKEYDFWVDLQEDPQGGIIKKYNVAEHKWEKIVSGTSNGGGTGESPNDNKIKDYSAQVANNLFELTKPKEYGPIKHFREKIDLNHPVSPRQFGILITCENEFYVQQYEYILRKFIKEWKKNSGAYRTAVNKLKFYIVVPLNFFNAIIYQSEDDLFDLEENDIIFTRTSEDGVRSIIEHNDIFHVVFHQKQEDLDADLYDKTSWFDYILKSISRDIERKSVIQTYPYVNYAFRDRDDYQNTQLSMFHKINDACDMYYQNGYDIIPAGTAVLCHINSITENDPDYVNANTLSLPNAYVYCSTVLYDVLTNYIFVNIEWLNENKHNITEVSDHIREAQAHPYYYNIGFLIKENIISIIPSDQTEINLKPTEQFQLRYTSDPFIPNLFEYISTDETVAKVNKRGLITAISPGSCKIRLKKRTIQSSLPGLPVLPKDTQVIPEYTIIVSNENDIESYYSNSKIFNNTRSYIFKPYNKSGVIKPTTIYIKKDGEVAHSGEKLNISSMKITQTVFANLKEINNTKEFWFSQHFCTRSELPLNFGTWKTGVFSQNSEIILYTGNNAENPLNFGFCTNLYHKDFIKDIYNIKINSKIGIQYVLFDKVGNSGIISPVFHNDTTSTGFKKLENYYNEHEEEYSDYAYCAFNFVTLSNEIDDSEYNRLIDFDFSSDIFG